MTDALTSGRTGRLAKARNVAALAVVLGLPLVAAMAGSRGAHAVSLNLGPGDGPYVAGFLPRYEIDGGVGRHWTRRTAEIRLPLELRGDAVAVTLRFGRPRPEGAELTVSLGGRAVDRFPVVRRSQEKVVRLGAQPRTPFVLGLETHSDDPEDLGLLLDRVRIETGERGGVRLRGAARGRAVAVVAVLVLGLLGAGHSSARAAALAAPVALVLGGGLLVDPWLTHRLLTGVPEALALLAVPLAAGGRLLVARGRVAPEDLRRAIALVFAAFLLRAAAVNHPDFYYPDLRTHARLAEVVRGAGTDFLVDPARYIWEHGVWKTKAYGQTYAFPYSPAFHVPFAASRLDYDRIITAMKLAAAAISTLPILLVFALARGLGISPLGAALMVVIPTYTSRLSYAFLPALYGHAFDLLLLVWLCRNRERLDRPRAFATGAALVAAAQLAYVSGVVNVSLLVAVLAIAEAVLAPAERLARGLRVLAMGLCGAAVAVAAYYRGFLPMVVDVLARVMEGAPGTASYHPVQGFFEVAAARTVTFFGYVHPVLAAAGLALLLRRGVARPLLVAWLVTYAALLWGRAKVPDIFLHGHETLFVTPLVALASGVALAEMFARRVGWRLLGGALLAWLAVEGLAGQWQAMARQLGRFG